ncbi:putative G3BP-like protein [Cucumis melo var. makuwa]|uniref:Putative G3BP-like protein n=1 Tax=Cucumis melo var. makuwa TaxID=1194695 RepID=A0A5D3DM71_CUCMM|nr:putative G3BP-like protein [Cucumis melo var. makuwa]
MAAYSGSVSAVQVGSYFVEQYYHVLRQQPDLVHQFYSEASSMIRVDGDSSETASTMLQIHTLIMSLNFTAFSIKTINSMDSWNGGILVVVSGSAKSKEFNGMRKFVQTFFLAPQEKGYFVLNDIFHFIEEEEIVQHNPLPVISENKFEADLNAPSSIPEPPVSDYVLEENAREYVDSVHIEDDPVDKYSLPEQQQQEEFESEVVVEEAPVEDLVASHQNVVNSVQEPISAVNDEPIGEPEKKTYASILRAARAEAAQSAIPQPSFYPSAPATSDWNHIPEPAPQHVNPAPSYAPEPGPDTIEEGFGVEDEGEPKSVYVRNLPPSVTEAEIEQEFKDFGRILPDGVFIRSRKEIGVCYAFVEFEDILGVQNALKASPIQIGGRQVYIEERRPNSSGARGGRRGRGRGSYQSDAPRGRFGSRSLGRGSSQDGNDYGRLRGNGFPQRGYHKVVTTFDGSEKKQRLRC